MESDTTSIIPIKFNKSYQVAQANELIRSRQDDLTIIEAKLLRLAIAQILKDDKDLKTYTVNARDLAEFLGIPRQDAYKELEQISSHLLEKKIYIREKNPEKKEQDWVMFHWVDSAEYRSGNITLKLSDEIKPFLIGLNELFCKYSYEEIISLPTNNAIRLYELLYSYGNKVFKDGIQTEYYGYELAKDEVMFPVDYLKQYFMVEGKYKKTAGFIERIIDPSIQEIAKRTVYPCTYRTVKERNRIKYIVFKLNDWSSEAGLTAYGQLLEKTKAYFK